MSATWAVLIAEDDALYRSRIAHAVPWGDLGCVLIAAVSSGEDALEVVRNRRIDLLVTDVEMPGISGIELMGHARALRPQLQCLMLSNFDTFDYVKSSLKQGADDYLLKQEVTPSTLAVAIRGILRGRAPEERTPGGVSPDAGSGMLVRRDIARALLTGGLADESMPRAPELLFPGRENLEMVPVCFALSSYAQHLAGIPRDISEGHFIGMLLDLCEEALGEGSVATVVQENLFGAVLPVTARSQRPSHEAEFLILADRLEAATIKLLDARVIVQVGGPALGAAELAREWAALRAAVQDRPDDDPSGHEAGTIALLDLDQERELFGAIVRGDAQAVTGLVRGLFPPAHEKGSSWRALLMLANDLMNLGIRVCKNRGIAPEVFLDQLHDPQASMSKATNSEDLVAYVDGRLRHLAERFKGAAPGSPVVQRATAIIHTRYGEALTLAGVAHEIGVSPAHLSRLLTSASGKGFGDELTATRLAAAKELLVDESLSVQQVSRRCGYANYTYFFNVFRKHVGMTPQTYRRHLAGQ